MRIHAERRIFVKVVVGGLAGLLVYFPLLALHTAWEEVIAAAVIGAVPGLVDRSLRTIWLGALACAAGWLVGSVAFGIWIPMGAGAWILAGAFLGTISGFHGGSIGRAIFGFVLGQLAGLVAEVSRYLTVVAQPLRTWDMQFILLVTAGLLLNLVAAAVARPGERPGHD